MMIVPGSVFIPKTASGGDPYWGNVVLLMHMDDDFSDEKGHTTTTTGASISGGRGLFDGNDNVALEISSDFLTDTTEDFTFEFFVEFSDTSNRYFIGIVAYSSYFFSGSGALSFTQTSSLTLAGVGDLTTGVRYHVAIARESGTLRGFIDGTMTSSSGGWNYVFGTGSAAITIGQLGVFPGLNGYLDNVRFTRGVARYTADFTVPSTPFPNS